MSPNNVSSCSNTNIWNLSNTMVALSPDCPSGPYVKNGLIRRNTTASCRCLLSGETFPSASVLWFDATGLNVSQSGKFSDLIIDGSQESGQYFCYETRFNDKTKRVAFKLNYFDVPEVVNVTVNGVDSVNVSVGDTVIIYCQVKSTDPPSKAVLVASGLGSVKEITSTNETLELSLRDLQCEDSGRYNCTGRNGFEDNVTSFLDYVDINLKCPIKSVQKSNTFPTIRVSPNENTVFTFEVYGYPEPTQYVLKTETGQSTSLIDQSKYKVTFLRLTPPLGQITVTVYDANSSGTTTYVLSVINEAGEMILKYQVIKEQSSKSSETPVSQIVGGCLGGLGGLILVSASVGISLWFVKRRRRKGSPAYTESNDVPMPDITQENSLQAEQNICTEIHFFKEDNRNTSNDTTI
uniref:Ig-like domain-containing protein n=1 Tax=Biomphalaria glabrata TaxID=6526 RepID=A0A2C9KLY3_BIOGL